MNSNDIVKYTILGLCASAIAYVVYRRNNPSQDTIAAERGLLIAIADTLMQASDRGRAIYQPLTRKDIDTHILLISHQYNTANHTNITLDFSVKGAVNYSAIKVVVLKGRHCEQEVRVYCN